MHYVGLDVHKENAFATLVDEGGTVVSRCKIDCTREALASFVTGRLSPEDRVVLEATTNTWAIVDILEPHVAEVLVSNPMQTKAIANAKLKTDKVDSEILAQLYRSDFLPTVWQPDPETRKKRSLMARRTTLVHDRTRIKNRIHAVLHQRLIVAPEGDLFAGAGRAFLEVAQLDDLGRHIIDSELRLLELVDEEIAKVEAMIAKEAWQEPAIRLLMTLPGVDMAVATTLFAAIGDIERFATADKLASYLGLVPSVKQSAKPIYRHGSITKQGNSDARFMMTQAAQHLWQNSGPLGHFFRKTKKKRGHNVAVVAAARKMVTIAWHMLKNNEPYRYATPRSTDDKLSKLRVRATGERPKRGPRKGEPRPANYGTGKSTRTIPSIDTIYEREGLPALGELAPGERRMIEETGSAEFVDGLHATHVVPRKKGGG